MMTNLIKTNRRFTTRVLMVLSVFLATIGAAFAQSEAFVYQGRLTDGGNPPTGSYDLEFRLFDSPLDGAGTQFGSTVLATVSVNAGVFTASLNFGACSTCFNGSPRFLQIGVRPTGGGAFTTLSPRQQITSTPYAIRSQKAASADSLSVNCTSCVTSNHILNVTGSSIIGTIPVAGVPSGSGSYIQNTNSPQAASNFNISGNGTVGGALNSSVVNATTNYQIGGVRLLAANGLFNDGATINFSNTFLGESAGLNTTPSPTAGLDLGKFNSFFGAEAGKANTIGTVNSFFGARAGSANTDGFANSFFGMNAGFSNTTGDNNSFFGKDAGRGTTTGHNNSIFGFNAGLFNTTGTHNSFFGQGAGSLNTGGQNNTMVGNGANFISSNATGGSNTALGAGTRVGSGISGATAIGYLAQVEQSNSLVLGGINGVNFASADTNVGIGTTTPTQRLHIAVNGANILFGSGACNPGNAAIGFAATFSNCNNYSLLGNGTDTAINRDTGGSIFFREANGTQMVIKPGGNVGIGTTTPDQLLSVNGNASKTGGGSWAVFSDERLKNINGKFTRGLSALMSLQPIRFEYRRDNALGVKGTSEYVGFSAQEVQRVVPEAVSAGAQGYLLINNDPILWTMLNAVKEQQAQITELRQQLQQQRALIRGLQEKVKQQTRNVRGRRK